LSGDTARVVGDVRAAPLLERLCGEARERGEEGGDAARVVITAGGRGLVRDRGDEARRGREETGRKLEVLPAFDPGLAGGVGELS
jgi:hypothetical protein